MIPLLRNLLLPILLVLSGGTGMAVADQAPTAPEQVIELLMFEQAGCIYCRRWDQDVSEAYPKTAEGRAAPLRRIDIHDPLPDDVTVESPPILTPTFVLARDGTEIARIEGYPGEDFFWPLLDEMLTDAGVSVAESPNAAQRDTSP
ncbi:hypothetical protein MLD63_17080 [Paracoccus sp. TK19116]|uniref:Thioredoxin family protein n=1 Tax=Paracoccus albicereus TaxID=2922394 RepID=A0ABT1MUW5_9RHOB|nr:hypothetical protein [Paracoccus albicereus]MCQ0972135.1 hypothetical protein [Paracoccus albicereus]